MMHESQFLKMDRYDWFCAPGSHYGAVIITQCLCAVDELLSSGDFSSGVGWEDEEEKDTDENAEEEEEEEEESELGESDAGGYIW